MQVHKHTGPEGQGCVPQDTGKKQECGLQDDGKQQYVNKVTEQIRCRRARVLVAEELNQHIEDQAEEFCREGMTGEEALREAVRQMGDPVAAGLQLDRIHRPRMEWKLLALVGVLTLAGLFVQYAIAGGGEEDWFVRQLFYTELGIGAMMLVYFVDYTLIGKYPLILWGGWTAFLAVGMMFGDTVNGLQVFLPIHGQYRIYPLLILLVPLFGGVLYRFRGSGWGGLLLCGICAAVDLLLACSSASRTSVFELLIIFAAMLTYAVAKGWFEIRRLTGYLMIYTPIALLFLFLYMGVSWLASRGGYAFVRMDAALHPERYEDSWGYLALKIREMVSRARLIGGDGVLREEAANGALDFSSDMIFGYVLVTFGVLAGILLAVLLGTMIGKIFRMSFRQKNQLGAMLGFGCACLFLCETVIYVSYNLGLTMFMPKYLPFFSKAGAGTVSLYILMGLVLSVYRNTNVVKEKPGKKIPRYRMRMERIV